MYTYKIDCKSIQIFMELRTTMQQKQALHFLTLEFG